MTDHNYPAAAELETPLTDTPQPRSLRKFTLRAIDHNTGREVLMGACIAGLDDDEPLREGDDPDAVYPLWQPQTADDLDKLIGIEQDDLDAALRLMALLQERKARRERRIARLLELYGDRVQAICPVPVGGTRKQWIGPWTQGKYINQPVRAEGYKLVDRNAAKEVGLVIEKPTYVLAGKGEIREYRAKHDGALPPGIAEVPPDPPVSFSPPKEAA